MGLLSDFILGFAALAAGAYCLVLSRRLRALARVDGGVGGAVAVLSAQVDELTRALGAARACADRAEAQLEEQTARAEAAVQRLELLLASLHELPHPTGPAPTRQGGDGQKPQDWQGVSAVAPRAWSVSGADSTTVAAHVAPRRPPAPGSTADAPHALAPTRRAGAMPGAMGSFAREGDALDPDGDDGARPRARVLRRRRDAQAVS